MFTWNGKTFSLLLVILILIYLSSRRSQHGDIKTCYTPFITPTHNKIHKKKKTLHHISSNVNNKLLHSDILMTDEISDHDTPCEIFVIKKERYESRYKYVRNEKDLSMNDFASFFWPA